jgi:hypothetical protein
MFLENIAPAKNCPPHQKNLLGKEFSGEEFFDRESSIEEFSGNYLDVLLIVIL